MHIESILPAGTWNTTHEIDRVLIDYDRRFRRRIVLTTVMGAEVLIDLPQAVRLRDGGRSCHPIRRRPGLRPARAIDGDPRPR